MKVTNYLIFCKIFSATSGQRINFSKSHVIFNNHASQSLKHHVCATLNMPSLGDQGTHLGIPFSHARKQVHIYQPLIQRLASKIESWRRQTLSKPERLVMI